MSDNAIEVRGRVDTQVVRTVTKTEIVKETDYNNLENKPQIEGVTLEGDKAFDDLGLLEVSNTDIDQLFN